MDAPEIKAALRRGLPVFKRGETLAALLEGAGAVAVAGTHGKTTTTGLIAQVLQTCGRKPSFCIGGEIPGLAGVAGVGNGNVLVVEADESDGTLSSYSPDYAVITNIEPDHMEHFGTMDALRCCFGELVMKTRKRVIYCADDPEASALCEGWVKSLSYGFSKAADVRGTRVKIGGDSSTFTVMRKGVETGTVRLPLPGRHNVANALGAIAVALEMGLEFSKIRKAIAGVTLPRRRFERVVCTRDLDVISDYGHHPSEIKALVAAVRSLVRSRPGGGGRIRAVFQPHRYSRTHALGPLFPGAFAGVDEVVLVPVYAASEKLLSGGTIFDLYSIWRALERQSGGGIGACHRDKFAHAPLKLLGSEDWIVPRPLLAVSLEQAWQYLQKTRRKGDILLVVGAGDVEKIADWAKKAITGRCKSKPLTSTGLALKLGLSDTVIRFDEPLGRKTTFRVGGTADIWMEIGAVDDLQKVVKYAARLNMPCRLLGGGSNVLVGDLGVRGITARLTGGDCRRIWRDGDLIVAGASVPLGRLLTWLEKNEMTGLEFLEAIPGTVGGAIRMNAGAWGDAIGNHVASVACIDLNGDLKLLKKPEFEYRRGVEHCEILSAAFKLKTGDQSSIRKLRLKIAGKRAWMKGLHCAGSVFRNPPGDFAGRLIEQVGLKGASIGGASIFGKHANVIVTENGARASDVLALMGRARTEVKLKLAVDLENEIELLE